MAIKKCIKLSATWCAPCKAFKPIFEKVSKNERFKDIEFHAYDVESEDEIVTELVERHGVRSIPTTLLIDENNEVLKKIIGSVSENDFISVLESEMK